MFSQNHKLSKEIIIYMSSCFNDFSSETLMTRNLEYLLQQKIKASNQKIKLTTADLNQDLVRASLLTQQEQEFQGPQKTHQEQMISKMLKQQQMAEQMSMLEVADKLNLVKLFDEKTKTFIVPLPQVFLVNHNGQDSKPSKNQNYLGDGHMVQVLEDCDMLQPIIEGTLCSHFRVHLNQVYFYGFIQDCLTKKSSSKHSCAVCKYYNNHHKNALNSDTNTDNIPVVQITAPAFDPYKTNSHNLFKFFENAKIPYTIKDPMSDQPSLNDFDESQVQQPLIKIHGELITIPRVLELATKQGVLQNVLNKSRCFKCLTKHPPNPTNQQTNPVFCKNCKPPEPEIFKDAEKFERIKQKYQEMRRQRKGRASAAVILPSAEQEKKKIFGVQKLYQIQPTCIGQGAFSKCQQTENLQSKSRVRVRSLGKENSNTDEDSCELRSRDLSESYSISIVNVDDLSINDIDRSSICYEQQKLIFKSKKSTPTIQLNGLAKANSKLTKRLLPR